MGTIQIISIAVHFKNIPYFHVDSQIEIYPRQSKFIEYIQMDTLTHQKQAVSPYLYTSKIKTRIAAGFYFASLKPPSRQYLIDV